MEYPHLLLCPTLPSLIRLYIPTVALVVAPHLLTFAHSTG